MNNDHIEGGFEEAKGKIKEAVGGVAGDAKTEYEGKGEKLAGQAQQAWGDAKEAASDAAAEAAEKLSGAAEDAEGRMRHAAEAVRAKAGDMGGRMCEAGASMSRCMTEMVKEQPLLTLLGAVAVGYLTGYLLHAPTSPLVPEPRYRRIARRWS